MLGYFKTQTTTINLFHNENIFTSKADLWVCSYNACGTDDGGLDYCFDYLFPDFGNATRMFRMSQPRSLGKAMIYDQGTTPLYLSALFTIDDDWNGKTDLNTIRSCLVDLKSKLQDHPDINRIAFPSIGSKKSKIDFEDFIYLIDEVFDGSKLVIDVYLPITDGLEEQFFQIARDQIFPYSYWDNHFRGRETL